jgi:nucleolar GTP-binding protein
MEVDQMSRKLERDLELEGGDDYFIDLRKTWDLSNPDEKYDVLPEVWQGHNVADFIDPEIMEKLDQLEAEEDRLEKAGYYDDKDESETEELTGIRKVARRIRETRKLGILESRFNKKTRQAPRISRPDKKVARSRLEKTMESLGLDMSNKDDAHYNSEVYKARSESHKPLKRAREDSEGKVRSSSRVPRDKSGVRDEVVAAKVRKLSKVAQRKLLNREGRIGEADRSIQEKKPKHLFCGKRKMGKTDRR